MDLKASEDLVSVIIPCYNRKDLLLSLLNSLQQQSYRALEIIIIDDYSTENIKEAVENAFPNVAVIRCRQRFGPAFAKNLGILKARGRYLLFLDSDTEIIHADMIGNMARIFNAKRALGQVGGEVSLQNNIICASGENISYDGKTISKTIPLLEDKNNSLAFCDYITTSNCFVEKKTIVKLGGFDPYYIYPGEDKDLGFRFKKEGYLNGFCPGAVAKHRASPVAGCKTYFYDFYRTKLRFSLKHKGLKMLFITPLFDIIRGCLVVSSELYYKLTGKKRDIAYVRVRLQAGNLGIAYLRALCNNLKMLSNIHYSHGRNYLSPTSFKKFVIFAQGNYLFR